MTALRGFVLLFLFAAGVAAVTNIACSHGVPPFWVVPVTLLTAATYGAAWVLTDRLLHRRGYGLSSWETFTAFTAGLVPLALNLPYYWYRSGASSNTDVDFLSNRVTLISELVLGAILLLLTLWILRGRRGPSSRVWDNPLWILLPVAAVWFVVGTVLSILAHRYMHIFGPNTAMVVQGLENAFDSRGPLYAGVVQAEGSSILGIHANFIFFLLYPFFKILPRYETVLALAQLAMVAAVFPLYKFARTALDKRISLLVALIYLVNPSIAGSAALQDMSELRFLAFPLFMSLYFYRKKRFVWFLLFGLLAISIREDVGLLYAILGLYALINRRSLKWWLVPAAFGTAWFVTMTNWVIPAFNPLGEFTRLQVVYEEYGGTLSGLITHFATHPWALFTRVFASPSSIGLVYGLWQTSGLGAPLLSGLVMLAVPGLAENLLLEAGTRVSINTHHVIIIMIPLIAAMVLGIARLGKWLRRAGDEGGRILMLATVIILFAGLSSYHVWFSPGRYTPRYNYDQATAMLEMIPEDSSLAAPMYMLVHASMDREPIGYYQVAYRTDFDLETIQEDYLIIDTVVPEDLEKFRVYQGLASIREAIESSGDFRLVMEDNDLQLYVRKGHPLVGEEPQ